ncbi:MlaA family lipoprotein [Acidocella facilis]|uniref:MlaA family lipoprotein n=1 Tax=Acidocella facilis TaxID=525 RepID=UPI00047DCB43|nr:VacJ family lipoprotein [Acidocella facilis]
MKTSLKRRLTQGLAITLPGLVLAGALTGCATPPPKSDTADYQAYQQLNDPLEPTNRVFFKVNNKLDTYVMKPVAKGYVAITTQGIRNHVGDFASNIGEPARMLNFMAEGHPTDAGSAMVRFLVNSTIGIGGIFDPASAMGYPETDTDFGITLATWGVPPGPYLYLPAFGPSGVRDAMNYPVSWFATPMEAAPASGALTDFGYSETGIHLINTRAAYLQPIDQINATALDPYATFRSLYRQSRASEQKQVEQRDKRTWPNWYHQ